MIFLLLPFLAFYYLVCGLLHSASADPDVALGFVSFLPGQWFFLLDFPNAVMRM
jgi:hypothetical protein